MFETFNLPLVTLFEVEPSSFASEQAAQIPRSLEKISRHSLKFSFVPPRLD